MTAAWVIGAFFLFVMAGVAVAGYFWVMRLAPATEAGGSAPAPAVSAALGGEPDPLVRLLERVGELIPASGAEARALRRSLLAAGYRSPSAVSIFNGIRYTVALLAGGLFAWIGWQVGATATSVAIATASAAFFGHMYAERALAARIRSRRDRLARALPDALDLMVLSLEAGQSLDQALVDCSLELRGIYPDLSVEFAAVHLELRAGQGRHDALRNLADRNGEPELRKLANVLIQSDRFGTSLAPALRIHARYLRLRRKQQAEEKARKIGIKLIFPIFFLIFPCMLLVTVGPALLQMFTQLLPMLTQP